MESSVSFGVLLCSSRACFRSRRIVHEHVQLSKLLTSLRKRGDEFFGVEQNRERESAETAMAATMARPDFFGGCFVFVDVCTRVCISLCHLLFRGNGGGDDSGVAHEKQEEKSRNKSWGGWKTNKQKQKTGGRRGDWTGYSRFPSPSSRLLPSFFPFSISFFLL